MVQFNFSLTNEGISIMINFKSPSQREEMQGKRGLTLIELIVVMCILGVMVLIAIPNIGRWLPRYRLKSAARDVASNMQLARLGAIKDNREWALLFDVNGQLYRIISDKGPDGNWGTPDDIEERVVNLSEYRNIQFGDSGHGPAGGGVPVGDGVTFVQKRAEFNPGGTSTAGTVYLQNNRNGAMAIRVDSNTGIVRMWTWDFPGWERL